MIASPPPEQLLQIRQLELHIGRAAVVALTRVRRGFHLAQQGVHLRRAQHPPRPTTEPPPPEPNPPNCVTGTDCRGLAIPLA